ncbi:transcriptional regulator [Paenibacillaceae bacterium]|nr:transcriptional regulator [Paenibacillaceae bacterium]
MLELSINDPVRLVKVAHALSTHTRVGIIQLLLTRSSFNIFEIAEKLSIPVSTAANNVKVLEDAQLIVSELQPASRGAMKVCRRNFDDVHITLNPSVREHYRGKIVEIEMPIGHFVNFDIEPTCGIAGAEGLLILEDDPVQFYLPQSRDAELIWFRQGWVEFRFPRQHPGTYVRSLEFSLELCSEAPNYSNDWPSDITVWVNDVEVGTWLSPGDFGDHPGKLNPSWWYETGTQHGLLKTWSIDMNRSTIDKENCSDTNIDSLKLEEKPYISFKIGIKPDAKHQGGINLFGKGFGDYPQAIMMRLEYD